MWIAVIAVVLVAVGAVVAKLTWRPDADEAHSVRNYRTALGTMEHFPDRTGRSTETIPGHTGGWEDPAARTGSPSVHITGRDAAHTVPPAPVPVPVPEAVPGLGLGRDPGEPFTPEGELDFDDARPDSRADRAGRSGIRPVAPEFRSDRARKQAFHTMEHRQWHWRTPAVVIVVLVVFGALALVGSRRSNHHATTKTSVTTIAGRHPTPVHHGSTTPTTSPKPTKPTPTTTTKPPTELVATSSTAGSATYSVSSTSYDVTVTANGTCWVDATIVSSGTTAWTGTLQPGASQVIHATGAMRVVLGASTAALTAENIPVIFPSPLQAPFTATFEPPPAAASTVTTTPSTTTSTTSTP
jgi:hypothetical protein